MTPSLSARSTQSRRRRQRVSTKVLVLLAVGASIALMVGRGTAQIVSQASCSGNPLLLNIAVSNDIAPAIQQIAQVFNREQKRAGGQCVSVQINPGQPAVAAGQIDGQHRMAAQQPIDAWIPDSSLWVDQVRSFAVGAQAVQPAGFSVARSPLLLVMPPRAAARTPEFGKIGWRLLLPSTAGGPTTPVGLRVELPDPTQNTAGLATVIEINRLLGQGTGSGVKFTRFIYSSPLTPYFDDAPSLSSFVSLAAPPQNGIPVTVTTEQAVISYDLANPGQPLAVSYPTSSSSALGSPEFDYPYVLTSTGQRLAAANLFGRMLRAPYAVKVIRYYGFRSPTGVPDAVPASFGLDEQLLQIATPASPTETAAELQVWNKLVLASRNLAVIDISGAMNAPSGNPGQNVEQEVAATANIGLQFFSDSTAMGLWEFPNRAGGQPYKKLVSVGPLNANFGLITRRDELIRINGGLAPTGGQTVALYSTILASYKFMVDTYQPRYVNNVLVLTSGVENAPGDISASNLIQQLSRLYNPAKRVSVIIVVFGNAPTDFPALRRIATATGGQAYQISKPSDVGKIFFSAVAARLCSLSCVGG